MKELTLHPLTDGITAEIICGIFLGARGHDADENLKYAYSFGPDDWQKHYKSQQDRGKDSWGKPRWMISSYSYLDWQEAIFVVMASESFDLEDSVSFVSGEGPWNEVDPEKLSVNDEDKEKLREFCKVMGIEYQDPKFFLVLNVSGA